MLNIKLSKIVNKGEYYVLNMTEHIFSDINKQNYF